MEKEKLILKKDRFPRGKSVRVNLKLSKGALETFDHLKKIKACKLNGEVFDYICNLADKSIKKRTQYDPTFFELFGEDWKVTTRKIFTLNQYALSKLRSIAQRTNLSVDEVVEATLWQVRFRFPNYSKNPEYAEIKKKYSDEDYVFDELYDIWSRVSELSSGLRVAFEEEYWKDFLYVDVDFNETLGYWLANTEGSLDELQMILTDIFAKKNQKKEEKKNP